MTDILESFKALKSKIQKTLDFVCKQIDTAQGFGRKYVNMVLDADESPAVIASLMAVGFSIRQQPSGLKGGSISVLIEWDLKEIN